MQRSIQVLASSNRDASGRSLYNNGIRALRLLRRLNALAALLCGLAVAGCSYQLPSLFFTADSDADQTGSIARPGDQVAATADASPPSQGDLAYARAAAAEVLANGGKDNSVPWQNPETGASGNITPLATSYTEGGMPCRDFLASYVRGGSQHWLQGAACRTNTGKWEVTRLKALSQS
jgi:surface antigen